MDVQFGSFVWDEAKAKTNEEKHGVDFRTAALVFADENLIKAHDKKHSRQEERWYAVGRVAGVILTVRYIRRGNLIRIIGAGKWRKGVKLYEKRKGQ